MRLLLRKLILFLGFLFHHNHRSKVFYYHDVSKCFTDMGTDLDLMQKHFEAIQQCGYKIVPTISEAKYQVMICFDDGWAGIYDVKDEFVNLKIFPTIFIAVDLIGKDGYLTIEQIKELKSLGFLFMAHTWSHQDLTTFNDKGLEHELLDSKLELEKVFGHSFDDICFPMGRFSNKVKEKSLAAGYKKLFSSLPGGYFDLELDNLICRNCAQNASPREFNWMLNGTSWIFMRKLYKQHYQK